MPRQHRKDAHRRERPENHKGGHKDVFAVRQQDASNDKRARAQDTTRALRAPLIPPRPPTSDASKKAKFSVIGREATDTGSAPSSGSALLPMAPAPTAHTNVATPVPTGPTNPSIRNDEKRKAPEDECEDMDDDVKMDAVDVLSLIHI